MGNLAFLKRNKVVRFGADAVNVLKNRKKICTLQEKIILLKNEMDSIGVNVFFVSTPRAEDIEVLTKEQKKRNYNWTFDFNHITERDSEMIKKIFGQDVDVEYVKALYDGVKVYNQNGCRYLADAKTKYVNVVNGRRVTLSQPSESDIKQLFLFGSCTARGTGVEDGHTVASFLQEQINKHNINAIRVNNCGVGCGYFLKDDLRRIDETDLRTGDVIVILEPFTKWEEVAISKSGYEVYNSSHIFNEERLGEEWFTDYTGHTTKPGNRLISKYIFRILQENKALIKDNIVDRKIRKGSFGMKYEKNPELESYLKELREVSSSTENNGAIVMNCNPFTLGHKYLISTVAKQVETLYVFVVEENKSFFTFEDRLKLVREGTRDIENVIVIPSGKFVLSAFTFPGYFNKETDKDVIVDTTEDLTIFAQYIAPVLNIRKRFVGEEPLDPITNQYNQSMKEVLPRFGIELIEIPRKTEGEDVISASRVRKLLKEKRYEEIKKLVPETTYKYLREKY